MWACGHAISSNLSMAKMSVQGGSCNADEEAAAAMHVWPGMMQPGSVQGMRQPGRQDGHARQAQGVVPPDVDGDLLMDRLEAEEEARAATHGGGSIRRVLMLTLLSNIVRTLRKLAIENLIKLLLLLLTQEM